MRKNVFFLVLFFVACETAYGNSDLSNSIKKDFENPVFGTYSFEKTQSLALIEKQITEKQALINKINQNQNLSDSQKKSKTSLLEKEINTLTIQKNNLKKAGG